ncbi:unnamed protein product, partial [Mesorhabditis spiculigera]
MPKILILLCLLAILAAVTAAELAEPNAENSTSLSGAGGFLRALRLKRGALCWNSMRTACCGKKGCKADGCTWVMCTLCC